MNINIYRCTFSKNVCMPSGAGFVKTVTTAAPPALLVETKRVCEKGGREHILNFCYLLLFFQTEQKKIKNRDQLHALNVDNQTSAFRFDCYCLFFLSRCRGGEQVLHIRE